MLVKISGVLVCAVLVAGLSQPTFARGKTNTANTATVTGCLTQGDEPNEYAVKATEDGKTYGLKSSNSKVDLAQHLNHKVTVTGTVSQKEKTKVSKSGKPEEDAHMKVTDLKMVSPSCQ
jgi:maltose-binding protein MalE